ncbi:hypothetical protein CgunFtcFv8_027506 [Champsocephalus gunnari]|uniref:Paralemmin n=1 Tax=Champsocephalus gunnari TaxID=52237 RepID=A0AAN8DYB4_CHAGU|nr:hypothetical protein CgunFtcFv8_027506 [Champsocephalus gunnari]
MQISSFGLQRTDLHPNMEVGEAQDRQLLLAEKRKWQTEIENKKRQLEDDRRALQHLKSKALRERWLLEGAAPGPEQDERRKQLQLDEDKTRSLEEDICRSFKRKRRRRRRRREEEKEEEKEEAEVQEPVEIPGVEAQSIVEVNVEEASAENPVTMVFMGYQSVEDEDETKKVLGVQGSVKAELVLIDDGKTSPDEAKTPTLPPPASPKPTSASPAQTPVFTDLPPANKPQEEAAMTPSNGGTPGETSEVQEIQKEKQPCKCCSIM